MDGVIGAGWLSSATSFRASSTGAYVASGRNKNVSQLIQGDGHLMTRPPSPCQGTVPVIGPITQPVPLIARSTCPGDRTPDQILKKAFALAVVTAATSSGETSLILEISPTTAVR